MKTYLAGVVEWYLPTRGPEALKYVKSHGLHEIQIDFRRPGHLFCLENEDVLNSYSKISTEERIKISGIAINVMNQLGFSVSQQTDVLAQQQILFLNSIKAANKLGVDYIFIPSFHKNMIKTELDFEKTVCFFKWACNKAKKHAITVASENSLDVETNLVLYDSVNCCNFKIVFDSYNLLLYRHDPAETIGKMRKIMAEQVHFKDGINGLAGKVGLGKGNGNVAEILKLLLDSSCGYRVFLENKYKVTGSIGLENDIQFFNKIINNES